MGCVILVEKNDMIFSKLVGNFLRDKEKDLRTPGLTSPLPRIMVVLVLP